VPQEIRGDVFIDRLGGSTEMVLAAVSLAIACNRMRGAFLVADLALAGLFALEVVGAAAIFRSRLPAMRFALWLFVFRVGAGVGYMSLVHGDKLARNTLGFPLVVAIYCWARVRAMRQ
jgi:hypothetical protein